ncbi:MAG: hypothetical protein OXF85_02930 [Candidatus Saccharibacteria bacterium]|nr:hypothetical protein [Candidatus Saccharibacteria bacterium]
MLSKIKSLLIASLGAVILVSLTVMPVSAQFDEYGSGGSYHSDEWYAVGGSSAQLPSIPEIYVSDVEVWEGSTAVFTIEAIPAPQQDLEVMVEWETVDVSAEAGVDYQSASGTVILTTSAPSTQVAVRTLSDEEVESNEVFGLRAYHPSLAGLGGHSTGLATIKSQAIVSWGVVDIDTYEGVDLHIPIEIVPNGRSFDMWVLATGSTATGYGVDYDSGFKQVHIPANSTSAEVVIHIAADNLTEGVEHFGVVFVRYEFPDGVRLMGSHSVGVDIHDS